MVKRGKKQMLGGFYMEENIKVFTQNSIRVIADSKKVYIDPYEMKETPNDADFILITHDHGDHFSPEDIAKVVGKNTILVVPEKMADKAKEVSDMVGRIETVKVNGEYEIDGLKFETVPSYNKLKPFHPKSAGWVGYIISANDKRVYIAGDTDAVDEIKKVKCDVALVPIGGTYTMNAKEAAAFINIIKPETAIPVHYGSVVGKPQDADNFKSLVDDSIKVEIILGK